MSLLGGDCDDQRSAVIRPEDEPRDRQSRSSERKTNIKLSARQLSDGYVCGELEDLLSCPNA